MNNQFVSIRIKTWIIYLLLLQTVKGLINKKKDGSFSVEAFAHSPNSIRITIKILDGSFTSLDSCHVLYHPDYSFKPQQQDYEGNLNEYITFYIENLLPDTIYELTPTCVWKNKKKSFDIEERTLKEISMDFLIWFSVAGGCLFILAIIFTIIFCACWLKRRHRRKQKQKLDDKTESEFPDPPSLSELEPNADPATNNTLARNRYRYDEINEFQGLTTTENRKYIPVTINEYIHPTAEDNVPDDTYMDLMDSNKALVPFDAASAMQSFPLHAAISGMSGNEFTITVTLQRTKK